ncbi:hypothetical protein VTN00DRAFT_767 [Thermoascus crustaceus]|uniref:uncharacterized protein n=1 Tax=Thermoascus crustaceus TaxID=5088 RepID=UPI003742A8ED
MGKGGRIACIFTPYVLTIASAICLVLVGLGCTQKESTTLTNLHFFRADLSNFTSNPQITTDILKGTGLDQQVADKLSELLSNSKSQLNVKDFYLIGLWNYCSGDKNGDDFKVTYCSESKAGFWFNPVEVWHLNGTGVENLFPEELQKGLNTYKSVTKWMFVAYIIAFFATAAEILVGVFAICSRWGSCVTSLVSSVSAFFTIAASVTATALYAILTGTFNNALKPYQIHGNMGSHMYATTWLAVAFSLGATMFWLLSSCCCSGSSPYRSDKRSRRVTAEKAPYTYERVESPYGNTPYTGHTGANVPMQNMRSQAYEPYRHV